MYGIELDPWLDEQQLIDASVIQELVDASEVTVDETVIEIGPGAGNITATLLERAGKVIAVEKNPKYWTVLKGRFGNNPKLETVIRDVLIYRFPRHDRIVSNLPYMISEPLFHLLFHLDFKSASFIVSKKFADKITDPEGDTKLNYLSRMMFESALISEVQPRAYLPPPGTLTAIITVKPREPKTVTEELLQAFFRQEDKKTMNALREALIQTGRAETKRQAKDIIASFKVSPMILETPVSRLSMDQIMAFESYLK